VEEPCRCRGGNVEDRPGGEAESIEGNRSLGLLEFMPFGGLVNAGNGSLVGSLLLGRCMGGSSIEDLMALLWASVSDNHSYIID